MRHSSGRGDGPFEFFARQAVQGLGLGAGDEGSLRLPSIPARRRHHSRAQRPVAAPTTAFVQKRMAQDGEEPGSNVAAPKIGECSVGT